MNKKEKIIGLIGILIFITFAYFINNSQTAIETRITENKYETICKVFKIESRRSFTHIYFYYYYNGIRYERWDNTNLTEGDVVNKFFRVNLSTLNPKDSKILLDKEITDSTEIILAGFKNADL